MVVCDYFFPSFVQIGSVAVELKIPIKVLLPQKDGTERSVPIPYEPLSPNIRHRLHCMTALLYSLLAAPPLDYPRCYDPDYPERNKRRVPPPSAPDMNGVQVSFWLFSTSIFSPENKFELPRAVPRISTTAFFGDAARLD